MLRAFEASSCTFLASPIRLKVLVCLMTGTIKLPEGTEMVMPGDNIAMEVTLLSPIAMDKGLKFAIREGGRTVGAGVVAEIIE